MLKKLRILNIIKVIRERSVSWLEHAEGMNERNVQTALVGKHNNVGDISAGERKY